METYSGLITGGLGLPACQGMITMRFHLFPVFTPPPPVDTSGGGGSYPLKPGNIQNLYQPVDSPKIPLDTYSEPYLVPTNREFRPVKKFKFVVTIGENKYEKDVHLPVITRKIAFNVVNLANSTIDRINVIASGFKKIVTKAKVVATSFRRHK